MAPQRHFTHSRVMVWVAFDRAVGPWRSTGSTDRSSAGASCATRSATRSWTRASTQERNTFTQHYDTTEVDASLLTLPLVGFLDGDDPRVLGTIEAIEADLMRDGLLLRYRTQTGVDGLAGDEHPFLACSFWLVLGLRRRRPARRRPRAHGPALRAGQRRRAAVGGVRPVNGRMAGNFPQAFSHLTLVQAASPCADRRPRAVTRSRPGCAPA